MSREQWASWMKDNIGSTRFAFFSAIQEDEEVTDTSYILMVFIKKAGMRIRFFVQFLIQYSMYFKKPFFAFIPLVSTSSVIRRALDLDPDAVRILPDTDPVWLYGSRTSGTKSMRPEKDDIQSTEFRNLTLFDVQSPGSESGKNRILLKKVARMS